MPLEGSIVTNKLYFFIIAHIFITTSVIFAMDKPDVQFLIQTHNTPQTFDVQEKRNLRAALKPMWQATPMP